MLSMLWDMYSSWGLNREPQSPQEQDENMTGVAAKLDIHTTCIVCMLCSCMQSVIDTIIAAVTVQTHTNKQIHVKTPATAPQQPLHDNAIQCISVAFHLP